MTSLLETQRINETKEGVTLLLHLLGQHDTLVSDMTTVGDFEGGVEVLESLSVPCAHGDFLWEVANRIRRYKETE